MSRNIGGGGQIGKESPDHFSRPMGGTGHNLPFEPLTANGGLGGVSGRSIIERGEAL